MKISHADDETLRGFAESYPYSHSELREMLISKNPASTAAGLIAHLKKSVKKPDFYQN